MGRAYFRHGAPTERSFAWFVGVGGFLLQGWGFFIRRRAFDACIHRRASCQSTRLADSSGVRRRAGTRPTYSRPNPDACGIHRLQTRWRERCGSRGMLDLSAVIPDDTLDPAIASQDEGPSMAQGFHAWSRTSRDRRTSGFAGADDAACCARSFHLGSSCTNHWRHVAWHGWAASADVWWRIDWTAKQGEGVGTYSRVGKMMPAGRGGPIFGAAWHSDPCPI